MPDDANLRLQLVLLSGAVEWSCKILSLALASLLLYINRTIMPTTTTPALYTREGLRCVAPVFIVPNPYVHGTFYAETAADNKGGGCARDHSNRSLGHSCLLEARP